MRVVELAYGHRALPFPVGDVLRVDMGMTPSARRAPWPAKEILSVCRVYLDANQGSGRVQLGNGTHDPMEHPELATVIKNLGVVPVVHTRLSASPAAFMGLLDAVAPGEMLVDVYLYTDDHIYRHEQFMGRVACLAGRGYAVRVLLSQGYLLDAAVADFGRLCVPVDLVA